METESTTASKIEVLADKIAQWVLIAIIILVPFFFIPSRFVSFQFAKIILIYAGIIVAFAAWVIGRLKDGRIIFPRHYQFLALLVIPVVYLVTTLVSGARSVSFVGHGFEIGTLLFIVAMCFLTFLVSVMFDSRKFVAYAYLGFILSFAIVGLFHLLRLLFGPSLFSFGVFPSTASSIIGTWNDFGIYVGAVALFSFISLELLKTQKWLRTTFIIILVASLFFLSVVNFSIIWYILAAFALIFFIYNFSFNKTNMMASSPLDQERGKRAVPITSLAVIVVSFAFILFQNNIYSTLANNLGMGFFGRFAVDNVEVRPSWSGTTQIALHSLKTNPIFGTGPNRFLNEWLVAKPTDINNTVFWSTDFNYAVGLIPTFLVTTGLLGFLSWLAFLALFVYMGFKALFTRLPDPFANYAAISSFVISLYLWIFAFIYVPSATLLVITFFFTGIFFATLVHNGLVKRYDFNFVKDPRTSFVSVLVFVVLLLGTFVISYGVVRKFISAYYFNQGLYAANVDGNITDAETNIVRAVQASRNDYYYRTLSEVNLVKINQLLAQQNVSPDVLQNQFRAFLAAAQTAAQQAVEYDRTNYENWLALGRVFESVVPFNVSGAFESAQQAYNEAAKLNPKSPAILLIMARLDVAHKDIPKAKEHISQALALKNNYTDAIFFLSQIQVNEGDLKSAIQSVEAAALLTPNDPGVYFQLGLLRYNDKNYSGAASAFEQAIILVGDYANAKYFLGLSYDKLNRDADAIRQFEDLKVSNPDNAEVNLILTNLRAGRDPFANARPPIDNTPERRSQPPVEESSNEADTADR